MRTLIVLETCLFVAASANCAFAAAPPELLNKSIRIGYTVTIPGRGDDGSTVAGVRNVSRAFYISSAGRIFARVERVDGGRFQATKEVGPGESGNTLRFEGRKLVGKVAFVSGAGLIEISFDSGGGSCNASVVMGREGGRALRWKGVNGVTYQASGAATVSNVSCAMSEGNSFAK